MHKAQKFSRETIEKFKVVSFSFSGVPDSASISERKTFLVSDMQQLDGRISEVFSKVAACPIDTFNVLEYCRQNLSADVFFVFQVDAFLAGNHGKHQVKRSCCLQLSRTPKDSKINCWHAKSSDDVCLSRFRLLSHR